MSVITPLYDWDEALMIANMTGYSDPAPMGADHKQKASYVKHLGAWLYEQVESGMAVPARVRDWLDMDAGRAAMWTWFISSDDEEVGDLAIKYQGHKPDWPMIDEIFNRTAC